MANTYAFKINAVDVHTLQNDLEKVVYNVHWRYVAQNEDGIEASMIGVREIDSPDPENFVAFESLIQDDIIAWIEPLLNVDQMKLTLDTQIAEKVAPTKLTLSVPVSLEEATNTEESLATEETTEETV